MAHPQPRYVRVTPGHELPLPLSVDDMKMHLRIAGNDEDHNVEQALRMAVDMLDGWDGLLGRCIIKQDWHAVFPVGAPLVIRLGDLISVEDFEVLVNGVWTAVPPTDWRWEFWQGCVRLRPKAGGAAWPMADSVHEVARARFYAGFGETAEDVPAALRGMLRVVATFLYEHRGDMDAAFTATNKFAQLIASYRRGMI